MADATLTDRLVVEIAADLSPLSRSLSQAGRDMNGFASGPIANAALAMGHSFNGAFGALERSAVKAARTGEFSIRGMVNTILADLSRVAVKNYIVAPIERAASGLIGAAVSAIGGLATGGPAGPGSAYIVGEHGPELFVPSGNGQVVPGAGLTSPRQQIVFNVQAQDAQSFLKSESQIAAMMMRALSRGQRNL